MEQKSQKNYIQYLYTKEGLKRWVEKVKQISSGMAIVQSYLTIIEMRTVRAGVMSSAIRKAIG